MNTLNNYFETVLSKAYKWKTILLQIAVVGGVLLVSVVIAFKASKSQIQILVLLIFAMLGLAIILQKPALGLILTIVGGFFVRFSGPSGLNVTMIGIAFLFALWIGKMFIVDRNFQFAKSRTIYPIIVFIILSVISFGVGWLPFVPFARRAPVDAQLGGLAIFILSAAAFLVTAHLTTDIKWLEWLTWVFIGVGASYMIARIIVAQGIHLGRPFDPGATTGSMFPTWLVALTFSQAWLNKRLHPAFRVALGFLLAITFYVTYGFDNDWKSGWVPPIIAVIAIIGFRYWRLALLLAPIGLIVAFFAAIQIIGTDTYSWGTRVDAWIIVIEIAKASPFFGLGFANYYWYSRFFPIRGWYVPFNSHSQYIDLIAQIGILGTLCFLWIFWEVGRLGWSLKEKVPEGFPHAYVYGVLGGLIGTLVAASLVDWVLPFVYNIGFPGFRASVLPWIFMGGLVYIEQFIQPESDASTVKISLPRSN